MRAAREWAPKGPVGGGNGWRRIGGFAAVLVLLAALGAPAGAQQRQGTGLGSLYSTFFLSSEVSGGFLDSRETYLGFGYLNLRGRTGAWAIRPELGAGFISGTRRTEGLLGLAQLGFSPVLTGDYLAIGQDRALEFYPVGVGGVVGQWIWSGGDEEAGRRWSPLVSGGVGARLVDRRGEGDILSFELLYEHRTRLEGNRLFVRLATHAFRR